MTSRLEDIVTVSIRGTNTAVVFFSDGYVLCVTVGGETGYKSAGTLSEVALFAPSRQVVARFTPSSGYFVWQGYNRGHFIERWQTAHIKALQLAKQGVTNGPWSILRESGAFLPLAHVRY